jgi:hypothetical protein
MEITPLSRLDLRAPLVYSKTGNLPAEARESNEFLLLYELDRVQSQSIEPVKELFLGKLASIGKKTVNLNVPETDRIVLPAGDYAFTQRRSNSVTLKQEEWLDMAIEQQKDALWGRYKLKNQLYVRYLYEDGLFVIQLFRPC